MGPPLRRLFAGRIRFVWASCRLFPTCCIQSLLRAADGVVAAATIGVYTPHICLRLSSFDLKELSTSQPNAQFQEKPKAQPGEQPTPKPRYMYIHTWNVYICLVYCHVVRYAVAFPTNIGVEEIGQPEKYSWPKHATSMVARRCKLTNSQ